MVIHPMITKEKKIIGDRLKQLRKNKGCSREMVALNAEAPASTLKEYSCFV